MIRRFVWLAAVAAAYWSVVAAARPMQAVRDQTPSGAASIAGTVIDRHTREPLRRALVQLQPTSAAWRSITTDDRGRFAFADLPAGGYVLLASEPRHLSAPYNSETPGGPARPVKLADRQHLEDIVIPLGRGAVISGVISNAAGKPVANAGVRLLKWGHDRKTGARALAGTNVSGAGATDDRGAYRFYQVPPGEYVVATTSFTPMPMEGAVPFRRVLNGIHVVTHAETEAALRGAPALDLRAESTPPMADAPAYYPGVSRSDQATVLTVSEGETRVADFSVAFVPLTVIRCKVILPAGLSARPAVNLVDFSEPALRSDTLAGISPVFTGEPAPPNEVSLGPLLPGDYVVTASVPLGGASDGGGPALVAKARVTVNGQTTMDVILVPGEAASISGHVVIDGDVSDQTRAMLRLGAQPLPSPGESQVPPRPVSIDASGKFAIEGLFPGRYVLRLYGQDGSDYVAGWTLRSALVNRQDMADHAVEVPDNGLPNVIATLAHSQSQLTGTVRTRAGDPLANGRVVVFSADRAFWGPQSRRAVASWSRPDGSFRIDRLPPGDYLVVAMDTVDEGSWFDPDFLKTLVERSVRVTLVDGEAKNVDLTIK